MASSVAESAGAIVPGCRRHRGDETPEPVPRATQHPSPNMSPKTPDRTSPCLKAGACFSCGQEGHWSRDCPSKERGGGAQLGADTGAVNVPNCYCGERCVVLISKTDKNPGRKFFRCSNPIMTVSTAGERAVEGTSFVAWK